MSVGLIALLGIDAETATFMLLYLNMAFGEARREGRLMTRSDFRQAAFEGAVLRIRPKSMTFCALLVGLLPLMWSNGVGSEVMKRVAAPIVGGLVSSVVLELLVYPPVYEWWVWRRRARQASASGAAIGEAERSAAVVS
ncbi:MAG TPA: efflux RND transporter permease subunit [Candidatus Acidoferrum sp.]|nr:efflux RND transporter permease subunit [Candidatus Acidoferrum sp.]